MIIETIFMYGVGVAASATGAYLIYRHLTWYEAKLTQLEALANESERAQALGITYLDLETQTTETQAIAARIRREDIALLTTVLKNNRIIAQSKTSNILLNTNNDQQFSCLFDYEIYLLRQVIRESSYFSTNPEHEEFLRIVLEDNRFNLLDSAYYAHFSNRLQQQFEDSHSSAESNIPQTQQDTASPEIQSLQEEIGQLNEQITEQHAVQMSLLKQLKQTELHNDQLVNDLTQEKTQHKATRAQLKHNQKCLSESQSHLVTLSQKVSVLTTQLASREQEIQSLQQQLDKVTDKASAAEATCLELESRLGKHQQKEINFEARIKRLETLLDSAASSTHGTPSLKLQKLI